MRHWYMVTVDRVAAAVDLTFAWNQMGDDLMAIEVEVNPFRRTTPFGASELFFLEEERAYEIMDREGEMERTKRHG